jgi:N-acyl homoserine lactone hydrolase
MSRYTIYPLRVGTVLRRKDKNPDSPDRTLLEEPVIAYYLEGPEHKIMVDTGGVPPDGVRWMPYWRKEGETPEEALEAIGVSPGDIDIVINTHLHWDHAGGNDLFENAEFFVQKREFEYLSSREGSRDGAYDGRNALETEYTILDGDREIVPGISVVLAPGHSAGMQFVLVDTRKGQYAILSDIAIKYDHWESRPRITIDKGYDTALLMRGIGMAEKLGDRVLPGHDPRVFTDRKPQ